MATIQDTWFVRLPDGRVIRSRNTLSLRYHVRRGRIPRQSRVRRSASDAWQRLEDVQELAEAAQTAAARTKHSRGRPAVPPRKSTRADFQEWRLLGVRGLVRELVDALDSSLNRAKMGIACLLGVLAGIGWITWELMDATLEGGWWTFAATAWAVVLVLVGCVGVTLITQFTAFELSRMRAPRAGELWPGAVGHAVRLAAALLVVVGAGVAFVILMRWLPEWLLTQRTDEHVAWEYAASAALVLRLILEVVFWPVIALAPLLLSPILVVQDCSFLSGIREWWRLLRLHLGRIFLYEALATTLAGVFTIPLLIPIALASWSLGLMSGQPLPAVDATVKILGGIALTPLIAYLLVANVFIYLNLRYEFYHSAR